MTRAATLAKLSRPTWAALEDGSRETLSYNYSTIERVLRWESGSIDAILAGGEATLIDEPTPAPQPTRSNADMVIAMIVTALDFPGLDDHQRVRQIRGIIATDYRPAGPPPPPVENDQRFEAS